jgi:hypothetical protein
MTRDASWQKTCPLCGRDNQCAVAAGRPLEDCWCANVTINPRALADVPPESAGQRCLCPGCGQTQGEFPDDR